MRRLYLRDCQAGDVVEDVFMMSGKQLGATNQGKPYIKAIVGDFTAIRWGVQRQIPIEVIRFGDPDGSGDLKRANQIALRLEVVYGTAIMDTDAFAVIADRVGGNGLYSTNAQLVVYKLIGDFDPKEAISHGFIDSQRYGIDVFRTIPDDAPLVVVAPVRLDGGCKGAREQRLVADPVLRAADEDLQVGRVGRVSAERSIGDPGVDLVFEPTACAWRDFHALREPVFAASAVNRIAA